MTGFGLSLIAYMIAAFFSTVVLGIIWYSIEKYMIVPMRRVWYNSTRSVPMSASTELGILLHRSWIQRRWIVTYVSIVQSLWFWWAGHSGIVAESIACFIEIPAFLIGFFIGARLHAGNLVSKLLAWFDRTGEAASTMTKEDVASRTKSAFGSIPGSLYALAMRAWKSAIPEAKPVTQPPVPQAKPVPQVEPELPEENSRDVIDRYTRRR